MANDLLSKKSLHHQISRTDMCLRGVRLPCAFQVVIVQIMYAQFGNHPLPKPCSFAVSAYPVQTTGIVCKSDLYHVEMCFDAIPNTSIGKLILLRTDHFDRGR